MRLAEETALRLATGCAQPHLFVCVTSTPTSTLSLHSFEWLECNLRVIDNVATQRRMLRSFLTMVGTWLALTCCRGYGPTENPEFWSRVVTRFHGGELGWMARPTSAIPQVRLAYPMVCDAKLSSAVFENWLKAMVTTDLLLDARQCERYVGALRELSPYILSQRVHRVINVQVGLEALRNDAVRTARLAIIPLAETLATWTQPAYRLISIGVPPLSFASDSALNALLVPWAVSSCRVRSIGVKSLAEALARTILRISSIPDQPNALGAIYSLEVNPRTLGADGMRILCTFVPRTRTLRYLLLSSTSHFNATDWCWLGFAMFHPDSRESSWRELFLRGTIMDVNAPYSQAFTWAATNAIDCADTFESRLQHWTNPEVPEPAVHRFQAPPRSSLTHIVCSVIPRCGRFFVAFVLLRSMLLSMVE